MKFKTFLQEVNDSSELDRKYAVWIEKNGHHLYRTDIKDGVVSPAESYNTKIKFKGRLDQWKVPAGLTYAETINAVSLQDYVFDECKDLPDVEKLFIHDSQMNNLAGIEKLHRLKYIELYDVEVNCGLMRLFKVPNLQEAYLSGSIGEEPARIIEKHLKDHNIAECMDELIEAGFKEYAKL
jgi:hypothetical protein